MDSGPLLIGRVVGERKSELRASGAGSLCGARSGGGCAGEVRVVLVAGVRVVVGEGVVVLLEVEELV
eukprot:760013-Amphidinium_carterae.1